MTCFQLNILTEIPMGILSAQTSSINPNQTDDGQETGLSFESGLVHLLDNQIQSEPTYNVEIVQPDLSAIFPQNVNQINPLSVNNSFGMANQNMDVLIFPISFEAAELPNAVNNPDSGGKIVNISLEVSTSLESVISLPEGKFLKNIDGYLSEAASRDITQRRGLEVEGDHSPKISDQKYDFVTSKSNPKEIKTDAMNEIATRNMEQSENIRITPRGNLIKFNSSLIEDNPVIIPKNITFTMNDNFIGENGMINTSMKVSEFIRMISNDPDFQKPAFQRTGKDVNKIPDLSERMINEDKPDIRPVRTTTDSSADDRTDTSGKQSFGTMVDTDDPVDKTTEQKAGKFIDPKITDVKNDPTGTNQVNNLRSELSLNEIKTLQQSKIYDFGLNQKLSPQSIDKIIKQLSLAIDKEVSEINIKLRPEHLGEIACKVRIVKQNLTAQIDVVNPAVKSALEENVQRLEQALLAKGIEMQQIEIRFTMPQTDIPNQKRQAEYQKMKKDIKEEKDETSDIKTPRSLGYNTMEITI